MPPTLLACGSNAASHLAINHPDDVPLLTPTAYHPSLPPLPSSTQILDLVSTSAHSLLLLAPEASHTNENVTGTGGSRARNILLGAGTNNFGQLGPRCALWDDVKPESRWKELSLLASAGVAGVQVEDWEPVKIASTWTTSIVVYQRVSTTQEGSENSSSITAPGGQEIRQIVISCGSNDFGELGSSSNLTLTLDAPAQIPISRPSQRPTVVDLGLAPSERIQLLKGGQRHVIAVIETAPGGSGRSQRVMGWGASRKGELDSSTLSNMLGNGGSSSSKGKGKGKAVSRPAFSPPIEIDLPLHPNERIVNIALGASHTLALLSTGKVLAWGSDLKGQTTGIHEVKDVSGIAATWGGSYLLTPSGLYSQGSNTHSQLLRSNQQSGTGGGPSSGQLGNIEIPGEWQVEKIVAGSEHLLIHATRASGDEALFTGGWNEHGNLGVGDQLDRDMLTRVEVAGRIKGLWGGCASTWVWVE